MNNSQEKVAVLPKDLRPKREVRCLAPLLVNPDPQSKRDDQNCDDYAPWKYFMRFFSGDEKTKAKIANR